MVAISKSILLLLGAALACAAPQSSQPTTKSSHPTTKSPQSTPKSSLPIPMPTLEDISKELDCQAQCIFLTPPFGNKQTGYNVTRYMNVDDNGRTPYMIKNMQPIAKPCLKQLYNLKGNVSKITREIFDDYVLCNSETLRKNNDVYSAKGFNWKKNGFNKKQQEQFQS
ncbi:hypothetical protein CPB97_001970, partial [Podila verticillata]